jgi:hypothetical protein
MSLSFNCLTDPAQTKVGLQEATRSDLVPAAGTRFLKLASVLLDAGSTKLVHALLNLHRLSKNVVAHWAQQCLL